MLTSGYPEVGAHVATTDLAAALLLLFGCSRPADPCAAAMWRISGLTSVGKCGLGAAEGEEMKSPSSFASESEQTAAMENCDGEKSCSGHAFISAYTAHVATGDLSSCKMDTIEILC